jgi:transcriptional regulator with XRE-family HTH domain
MPAFSTRIRDLRIQHGMSQEELSEAVGISQNQISRYERGANDPTGEVLIALADVLHTTTDYLLGRSADPAPTIREADLDTKERKVVTAMRMGDRLGAIQIISGP